MIIGLGFFIYLLGIALTFAWWHGFVQDKEPVEAPSDGVIVWSSLLRPASLVVAILFYVLGFPAYYLGKWCSRNFK